MEFIKSHILTATTLVLGVVFSLLSIDVLSTMLFGAAAASFIFESGNANSLSEKIRQLLKL